MCHLMKELCVNWTTRIVANPLSNAANAIVAPVGSPGTPIPRVEVPEWWRQRYERMNARVKQGNVDLVFIGDSITPTLGTRRQGCLEKVIMADVRR